MATGDFNVTFYAALFAWRPRRITGQWVWMQLYGQRHVLSYGGHGFVDSGPVILSADYLLHEELVAARAAWLLTDKPRDVVFVDKVPSSVRMIQHLIERFPV